MSGTDVNSTSYVHVPGEDPEFDKFLESFPVTRPELHQKTEQHIEDTRPTVSDILAAQGENTINTQQLEDKNTPDKRLEEALKELKRGKNNNEDKLHPDNAFDKYTPKEWDKLYMRLEGISKRLRGNDVKTYHFKQTERQMIRILGKSALYLLQEKNFPDPGISLHEFKKNYFKDSNTTIVGDAKLAITTSDKMREQEIIKGERIIRIMRLLSAIRTLKKTS